MLAPNCLLETAPGFWAERLPNNHTPLRVVRARKGNLNGPETQPPQLFCHAQGTLTFEKDATFTGNRNEGVEVGSGPGGAIFVHVKGSINFMGKLSMTDNYADVSLGEGAVLMM